MHVLFSNTYLRYYYLDSNTSFHLEPAMSSTSKINATNLVWLDMEMTGLDPERERIIELATVVTDANLDIVAEGPVFAIHQPDSLLNGMDNWNTSHHNSSGLVTRVRASRVTEAMAEADTLAFLRQYVTVGKSPLCGNSVHQDRR